MNKQPSSTIITRLCWGLFFLALLFLAFQVIPRALGQRDASKQAAAKPRNTLSYETAISTAGLQARAPSQRTSQIPLSTSGVLRGAGTPGAWQNVANMPTDVYGAAGASDGTYFYAAGGYSFSQGNTLAVFNRYDPGSNLWTPMASMPQAAIMATAVYYPPTNKIYVFGGEDAALGTNYNITRIYDIASNTWSTGANMPDVHSFAAGGYSAATGKIYILSGYNTGFVTDAQPNTWCYDPGLNSWTDLTGSAPFPHPAGGFAYGVINDKLYVAGGRDAANLVINLTWEYDPVANAYTAKTDEPGSFQNNVPGSAAAQGLLWVFGGGNPFSGDNVTKAGPTSTDVLFKPQGMPETANSGRYYDPATNTWTSSPNMNAVRSFPSGGAIGSCLIIAAGGYNGSTSVATAETEDVCGGGTPTPTPTVTPTPTPGPCQFRVLIAYADVAGPPTMLQNQILAEPDVIAVDLFDAFSGTPTLAQLQQYDIVYAFSNNAWNNAVAMGDVLADYEDGGGVVVVSTFAWDNRGGWLLAGRWVTGGYSPYNSTSTTLFSTNTAIITDPGHPLMQGVSSLTAFYRNGVTLTAGAASVADWTDGPPAVAYKANNGHTAVGMNAYLGIVAEPISGDWGRTIVNAGRWLSPNCQGTPTPTPTPGQIQLRAGAHLLDGTKVVRLHWRGATSATVDIYRNDALLATSNNDGSYTDVLTVRGIYTYKVCEAGTMNCSNEVEVRFRGP